MRPGNPESPAVNHMRPPPAETAPLPELTEAKAAPRSMDALRSESDAIDSGSSS
jgi:hypothetical protein